MTVKVKKNVTKKSSGSGHTLQIFGIWVTGFGLRVSGFGLRVSGFGFRVSGFGFRFSGFGSRFSSFGFREVEQEVHVDGQSDGQSDNGGQTVRSDRNRRLVPARFMWVLI